MPARTAKYAVFFRNMNLGRPNSPTKAQFESALIAAGAEFAESFLTNGSAVFTATGVTHARKVVAAACGILKNECGLKEPAFLRDMNFLARRVADDPFASVKRDQVYQCCVSFAQGKSVDWPGEPLESARGDIRFLEFGAAEAFSAVYEINGRPGNPNALLEKRLGIPFTTRNWNTIQRMVHKYG